MAGAYNGSYYKGDIMTIEEAIEDLERRKRVLQASCVCCWDDAIEQALQALKEKAERQKAEAQR